MSGIIAPGSIAGLMLAEERIAWWIMPDAPSNPAKVTAEEVNAGINVACRVFGDGTYLRATASESVNRPLLCGGNSQGFGRSNYEGQIDVARFLDDVGHAIEEDDVLWDAVKTKGTTLWIATRVGPEWNAEAGPGDEISVFQVTTDNPQDPQTFSDYIEKIVPLAVSNAWLDQKLAA